MVILNGKNAVAGVAIGKIKRLESDFERYIRDYAGGSASEEQDKYHSACMQVTEEIKDMIGKLKKNYKTEQAAIMEAHLCMISDPMLKESITSKIGNGIPAPAAVLDAGNEIAALLAGVDDSYLRERAADIKDVGKRMTSILLDIKQPEFDDDSIILCGDEVEPSVIAGIPDEKAAGLILGQGSTTSHTVIIAKSRDIVTVVGLGSLIKQLSDGSEVIVDGDEGKIIIAPDMGQLAEYTERLKRQKEQSKHYLSLSKLPAVTKDGVTTVLAANIGNPQEIDAAVKYGCEGVGLFRTEFIYMGRSSFPSEDEQFEIYKRVIEKCGGKLCVIRTMDIGGDKPLPYLEIGEEDNPFLGWRAIRISLERTDIFKTQVKAVLRAAEYGNAAIMLPMVISLNEILDAKALIKQAMAELSNEGREFSSGVQIGIMVETPAAAVMAPVLAKECDFFSIGTNDLVQYTLAVDRGNPKVSSLYDHFNPAVLKLIEMTIKAAHENGIWAGMCGEMAGDPAATRLLVAMGIDELSMGAPSIPKVKEVIRSMTVDRALIQQALSLEDSGKVKAFLQK